MSNINFKPEQNEVLNIDGKNLIVSASAGSGKTTVMIQKIINLITLKGENVKNILVLTYTKASAEEMKQKLIAELYKEATVNKTLLSQIDDVPVADISTIHSFFQKMLKKYFMALNINPSFSLIDETLMKKIKEEALENCLKKYEEVSSQKYLRIVEFYGKSRNEKTIKSFIEKIYNFSKALASPEQWFDNTATFLYLNNLQNNRGVEILNNNLFETTEYYVFKFKKLQKEFEVKGLTEYVAICNTILSSIEQVKNLNAEFVKNCQTLTNIPTVKIKTNWDFYDEYMKLYTARENLNKFIKKVETWHIESEETVKNTLKTTKTIVETFVELTKLFASEFEILKLEKNVLDYDDLEKYMLKLLENENIKKEIKNSYAEIFVDEYQDANRVQEKILNLIASDNNRFMVGDVKQSIYGFRQAEPDIFLEKQTEYNVSKQSEVKFLNCNFRSNKQILNFVNKIFENIMTLGTAKIDYKNTSMLNGQAEYLEIINQNIPTVDLEIITKTKSKVDIEPTDIYKIKNHLNSEIKYTNAEIEAFVIAEKIRNMLGKKIYVPSLKSEKVIDFADITILLRNRGNYLTEFCGIFAKLNIPYYANTKVPLYADSDILCLINILKLCVNSNDDIALASIMHSVFGGFSFDEMAKIRLNSSKKFFYECVDDYLVQDGIYKKIIHLKNFIVNFNFDATYLGLNKTYEKYLDMYDYNSYILKKDDGLGKAEKVKKYLSDFLVNGFNFDVYGFLKYVEQNQDTIPAPSLASGYNCVNITTIHSSKGLEYPIVILANMGQDFLKAPVDVEIKLNQKLGAGVKFYEESTRQKNTTIPYEAISLANKREEFAEKLRLLYVALTRAKNHLIIVGTTNSEFAKVDNNFEILQSSSYLDLIVNSLNVDVIEKINKAQNISTKELEINIIDGDEYTPTILEVNNMASGKTCPNTEKILKNYYDYKYPYNTNVAVKNSVSGVMQAENEKYLSLNYAPKDFLLGQHLEDKLSDIGVLYHKALEEIDFDNVFTLCDVQNFLDKKSYGGKLDAVNIFNSINNIKKFKLNKLIKEQKFVMQIKHNKIVKNGTDEDILIQGIIDLIILGEKNILIDYKYTSILDENKIKNKYLVQLKLYKQATESALNKEINEVYLLLINQNKLIKIDI